MKAKVSNMHMSEITDGLPTKSAKIRILYKAGFQQAKIARFLGIRDQFVSNVVRAMKNKESGAEPSVKGSSQDSFRVKVGPAGRIVIPAVLRDRYNFEEGDMLIVRAKEDGVMVESASAALKRAQALVKTLVPEGVSLVDELINDRRREAERE